MGVDISEDMITHSSSTHTLSNLSFQQLDVNQGASFISSNKSTFSLVTSFSCLHWVPDVPAAVNLFNNVLSLGGKFLFVVSVTTKARSCRYLVTRLPALTTLRQILKEKFLNK